MALNSNSLSVRLEANLVKMATTSVVPENNTWQKWTVWGPYAHVCRDNCTEPAAWRGRKGSKGRNRVCNRTPPVSCRRRYNQPARLPVPCTNTRYFTNNVFFLNPTGVLLAFGVDSYRFSFGIDPVGDMLH